MKIFTKIFMTVACLAALAACKKDPVGGTAVEAMSGQWYCTVDVVDANGTVLNEDVNDGPVLFFTYNTVSNSATEMWLDDMGAFWEFKIKVNVDLNTLTFSTAPEGAEDQYNGIHVAVTGGKIAYGEATNPHGTKADAFEFTATFDDDTAPGTLYRIHGYRYTGFESDN